MRLSASHFSLEPGVLLMLDCLPGLEEIPVVGTCATNCRLRLDYGVHVAFDAPCPCRQYVSWRPVKGVRRWINRGKRLAEQDR